MLTTIFVEMFMDPIESTGSQQEQIGLESDSLESAGAALATSVTRQRQRTEKGKTYIAHLRWTDCQIVDKRIQRQIKEIVSLASTEENVHVVERNLFEFLITVEELMRCVTVLLDDLEGEDDQLTVANDWYAEKSKQINDFIEKTVRWISSAKEVLKQNLEVRSQASSRRTGASYCSHATSQQSSPAERRKRRKRPS